MYFLNSSVKWFCNRRILWKGHLLGGGFCLGRTSFSWFKLASATCLWLASIVNIFLLTPPFAKEIVYQCSSKYVLLFYKAWYFKLAPSLRSRAVSSVVPDICALSFYFSCIMFLDYICYRLPAEFFAGCLTPSF